MLNVPVSENQSREQDLAGREELTFNCPVTPQAADEHAQAIISALRSCIYVALLKLCWVLQVLKESPIG